MKGVFARQRQVHFVSWAQCFDAYGTHIVPIGSLKHLGLFSSIGASVGLGNTFYFVLLPVSTLACLAAIRDQGTPGAVVQFLFGAIAVSAGFILVTRGGLLLGCHLKNDIETMRVLLVGL